VAALSPRRLAWLRTGLSSGLIHVSPGCSLEVAEPFRSRSYTALTSAERKPTDLESVLGTMDEVRTARN